MYINNEILLKIRIIEIRESDSTGNLTQTISSVGSRANPYTIESG